MDSSNIKLFKGDPAILEWQSGFTYTNSPAKIYVERSGIIYKLITSPSSSTFVPGEWGALTSLFAASAGTGIVIVTDTISAPSAHTQNTDTGTTSTNFLLGYQAQTDTTTIDVDFTGTTANLIIHTKNDGPITISSDTLTISSGLTFLNTFSASTTTADTLVVVTPTGIVKGMSHSDVGLARGPNQSVQFNNGGAWTGSSNFIVDTTQIGITIGIGTGSIGQYSLEQGTGVTASANYSAAFGSGTTVFSAATAGFAEGSFTTVSGISAHAEGGNTVAQGDYSHSGGLGISTRPLLTVGQSTFNHSENTGAQTLNHGALANQSAILGGQDHNIETSNVRAIIVGGNAIKLTGSTYIDFAAVPSLAIMTAPTTGDTGTTFLTREPTTGIIRQRNPEDLYITHIDPVVTSGGTSDTSGFTLGLNASLKQNLFLEANMTAVAFSSMTANATYELRVYNTGNFDMTLDYDTGADGGEILTENAVEFTPTGGGTVANPKLDIILFTVNPTSDGIFVDSFKFNMAKP